MDPSAEPLRLSLDPALQLWVLLPITLATLLMALLRRNLVTLLSIAPRTNLSKTSDKNNLTRSHRIRRNAAYLSHEQFNFRKQFFVSRGGPFDKPPSDNVSIMNVLSPDSLANQAVGLIFTVVPQMLLGKWASGSFYGLIICRLPFTLTPRFQPMLQSGVEHAVQNLDVSYVSSLSWYILNLFGNSALLSLVSRPSKADVVVPNIASQMSTSLKPDKVFNDEREALLSTKPNRKETLNRLNRSFLSTDPASFAPLS